MTTALPLLNAVVAWLSDLPHLELIIAEQDESPRLDPGSLAPNARTQFVYNAGPFNKAWGLNVAARLATHELLVIGDADMIMSGDALSRAITVCRDHYDAVNPYSNLIDLSESETRSFLPAHHSTRSTRGSLPAGRIHLLLRWHLRVSP